MSQLRELDDTKAHFRIQPITPAFPDEYRFDVESLDQRTVTVNLHSTRERIGIPVSRVAEILNLGRGQTPVTILDGRLQWITTMQRWRFFPEEITDGSFLGLYKPSNLEDKRVKELLKKLKQWNFEGGWAYESEVPSKISAAYQPVYDEDGRYFRIKDRPDNLVLIVPEACVAHDAGLNRFDSSSLLIPPTCHFSANFPSSKLATSFDVLNPEGKQ